MIHKLLGLHIALPARDHTEEHRAATTLELFYDLVIVIAIAFTAEAFHHSIIENHTEIERPPCPKLGGLAVSR